MQITLKIHVSAYDNASATGAADGLWEVVFFSHTQELCLVYAVDSAIGDAISV